MRTVDRIALDFGSIKVTWYGIAVVCGFVAGLWTASRRAQNAKLDPEAVADLGLWLMIGGIAGARFWYVAANWKEEFAGRPLWEVLAIFRGGLVFYGGLVGAALATILYARARALPLWKLADVLAPSIPLGHFFGRIGCFINGCCYGSACSLPWAVRYRDIPYDNPGQPLHPVQLYEAFLNIVLYVYLARHHATKKFDGEVFAHYLAAYGIVRFGVEFFRGDYAARYIIGWLTPGQIASVIFCLAGLMIWVWRRSVAALPNNSRSK
ncbi:MAG: prolipoprotein diacylglyceryl transferase [Verrucomicrobiae bacterium]|nr:prolipoprotein diacylglyceryl transferase [Verrucomicrobiae bacterium]